MGRVAGLTPTRRHLGLRMHPCTCHWRPPRPDPTPLDQAPLKPPTGFRCRSGTVPEPHGGERRRRKLGSPCHHSISSMSSPLLQVAPRAPGGKQTQDPRRRDSPACPWLDLLSDGSLLLRDFNFLRGGNIALTSGPTPSSFVTPGPPALHLSWCR